MSMKDKREETLMRTVNENIPFMPRKFVEINGTFSKMNHMKDKREVMLKEKIIKEVQILGQDDRRDKVQEGNFINADKNYDSYCGGKIRIGIAKKS